MAKDDITLHCPKCRQNVGEMTPGDPNRKYTCGKCGRVTPWAELKTPSGAKLVDHIAKLQGNALKGVKGFKPRG